MFFLNGIDLPRNASEQAHQGVEVPLDAGVGQLSKGDLVFFGPRAQADRPEQVTHVGIYLQDGLFIHSSGRVQISSLERASPILDESHQVIFGRRLLPRL